MADCVVEKEEQKKLDNTLLPIFPEEMAQDDDESKYFEPVMLFWPDTVFKRSIQEQCLEKASAMSKRVYILPLAQHTLRQTFT